MEKKPVDKEILDMYVNRDEQPKESSFFDTRKEYAPLTKKLFTSEQELENRKNIYIKSNVKLPNTYFDHIKQIDSTLNFPLRPTSYTEDYEYTEKKSQMTLHPDDLHHYKKSFMKTYEEFKLKHGNVIRKK